MWILLYWIYWFCLKVKILFDYTNLFYTNEYEKNYKVILKYYQ